MSPFGWALLAVYVVGYLAWWRIVARYMVEVEMDDPDWADAVGVFLVATLGSFFWPIFLPLMVVHRLSAPDAGATMRVLAGESKRAKIERMEREAQRREAHIRRLEREAGL